MISPVTAERRTKETSVRCELNVYGTRKAEINTGIGFFDHMLTLLTYFAGFDLTVDADGDLDVDNHHTVEDIGIVLGKALAKALDDRKGVARYGTAYIPMDESLTRVVLDVGGRGVLHFKAPAFKERVGQFETECLNEFLYAFAIQSGTTLHAEVLYGENTHHMIEGLFKALGKALEIALTPIDSNIVFSTKGDPELKEE